MDEGEEEEDEDDDMPATLERLRDPHKRASFGSGGKRQPNSANTLHRNGDPVDGARGGIGFGSNGAYESPLYGESLDRPCTAPTRIFESDYDTNGSPAYSGKPAPLTQGALATPLSAPIEAKLERGKGKLEAPWVQEDDPDLVIEVRLTRGNKSVTLAARCTARYSAKVRLVMFSGSVTSFLCPAIDHFCAPRSRSGRVCTDSLTTNDLIRSRLALLYGLRFTLENLIAVGVFHCYPVRFSVQCVLMVMPLGMLASS